MNDRRVSVIVPSLDGSRGGNVELLRHQVEKQSWRNTEFLVVIGVRPNGRARNVGLARTSGELLLFIDDDVQLGSDDLIERMVKALDSDKRIALVGVSQQVPEDASSFARRCASQLERFEAPVVDTVEDTDFASHTCMMLPRSIYESIGGEHDLLPRGTDPDLRLRLRQAGYRVVLAPGAWAYHPPPESWRQLWRIYFRNGAGSAFVHRHFPKYSIDTAPRHEAGEIGRRGLPARATGFARRLLKTLLPPRPIPLVALAAYGCGTAKTFFFDKQQWSQLFRKALKYALLPMGFLRVCLLKASGKWPRGSVRILLYHRVEEIRKYPLTIQPSEFQRQMNWLKEHYPVLSLDEVPGLLEQDMKKDIFVITFDDGYRDNFTQAFPILDKLGLTAAVYLTTDYIGRDKEFPWLAKLGPPAYLVLDWEQVRQMKEAGWVFGTHTGSHVSLGAMNRDRQREEIERCTGVFSRQLGQPPRHFCYPFGTFADFNEDTLELLKEKNYHTATTAVAGANHRREDPLQLRRTAIDPSDSFFLYKCHLKGYLDVLAWKDGPTAGRVKRFLRRAIGL